MPKPLDVVEISSKALAGIEPFALSAPAVQPIIPKNAEPEEPAPTRPNYK